MARSSLQRRLIELGRREFRKPRTPVTFTGDPAADRLVNDIRRFPHAYVIGCIMDLQIRTERAWYIPYALSQKLGGFEFDKLANQSMRQCRRLISTPEPLHRFPDKMAVNLHSAISLIRHEYRGKASRIWTDRPTSAALILRFLQFRGVGPKIATMAANILARRFKVPLTNHFAIDISPDVHVKRVFNRLGLVPEKATVDQVVYAARDLYPQFPGILDSVVWKIGRTWCHPRHPECMKCPLDSGCPSAGTL